MNVLKILFISLLVTSCASPVNIDFDKSINFASFSSFTIDKKPVRISADTRINSPFMRKRIVSEIENQFSAKGYEVLSQKSELEIKYYLDIKHEVETQESGGVAFGFGSGGHHSAVGIGFNIPIGETTSIDLLVLTIDILSTQSEKLLWRGSLSSYLYEGATPESNNQLVNRLVSEILNKFPTKLNRN